ncbi:hypothetical protein [Oceanicoccus sagamiensis]|uniref:Uncharacterized protein n=1 Tax=Oceanicoccus sagamiensis TaxID=716816 RepID=A0A1X9NM51_9GAMM|nr:hypothetical protein [Oceanicoccus sagamiensis]ARN75887.1 hypothetical protein BST96_18325 [Oceanicoccus sagamiensis]
MLDSTLLFYITAELAVLLLIVCIFLMLHLGKLRKLVAKLEDKIVSLRKSIGKSRNETKKALKQLAEREDSPSLSFLDYLDTEIDATRDHHQSLNPDRDIVLDIAPDAPIDRQASALRHAFLIAEKEARYAGGEDSSSWEVLQAKLEQIIQFYEGANTPSEEPAAEEGGDASDEIAVYKSRIENLERFKKLFFDMESKWEASQAQAEDYYQQLTAMGKELGAGEEFDGLLDKYANAYSDIGDLIESEGSGATKAKPEGGVEANLQSSGAGKTIIANQEEILRLKNMAVDQHKVITELKKKLLTSSSPEDQQEVVSALTEQLEQQQRFMQEAETCSQLIEDELTRAMDENEQLRAQLETGGGSDSASSDEEVERIEAMVKDLTNESKDMLATIAALEEENSSLKARIESGGGESGDAENVEILKSKLEEMQQELLNLQTQHIELEERYLELKMK